MSAILALVGLALVVAQAVVGGGAGFSFTEAPLGMAGLTIGWAFLLWTLLRVR